MGAEVSRFAYAGSTRFAFSLRAARLLDISREPVIRVGRNSR